MMADDDWPLLTHGIGEYAGGMVNCEESSGVECCRTTCSSVEDEDGGASPSPSHHIGLIDKSATLLRPTEPKLPRVIITPSIAPSSCLRDRQSNRRLGKVEYALRSGTGRLLAFRSTDMNNNDLHDHHPVKLHFVSKGPREEERHPNAQPRPNRSATHHCSVDSAAALLTQSNMAAVKSSGSKENAFPGSILLVIHDFVARSADELSLAKGDRIELIERDDDFGDGWFLGRHMTNAQTGLFPEVYTTPAPRGTLQNIRRVSDGAHPPSAALSEPASTTTTSAHLRHMSGGASIQSRPASGSSAQQGSSPSLAQAAAMRATAPSTVQPVGASRFNVDSPVMNETLSVIDEHITDMHTPRSSYANGNKRASMSSVYSNQPVNRMSYIPGHETDEDEHHSYNEAEVMAWAPERVAEYLEDHGVERAHCDVFREQEISGEVLLAMDQSSIFIKEFSLGPVGRRLKTWHKIKALQDEVKQSANAITARVNSQYSDGHEEMGPPRIRSSTVGAILPRALDPSTSRYSGDQSSTRRSTTVPVPYAELEAIPPDEPTDMRASLSRSPGMAAPLQTMSSVSRAENPYRPSAQSIRVQQSRRHSSIDSTPELGASNRHSHRKQQSIDNKWQMTQQPANGRPSHTHAMSTDSTVSRLNANLPPSSPSEVERGYFSSNEVESSAGSSRGKKLALLSKSTSATKVIPTRSSRSNSLVSGTAGRNATSPFAPSNMFSLLGSVSNRGANSARSTTSPTLGRSSVAGASSPSLESKPMAQTASPESPIVTRLEYDDSPSQANGATKKVPMSESTSVNATPSPSSNHFGIFGKHKTGNTRVTSDAITKNEKLSALPVERGSLSKEDSPAQGSSTPSTESQSFDLPKSDAQSRASTGTADKLMPPPSTVRRSRAGTKKTTSAYTRGLEKKTPAESMTACDYSGWMKKKSGSLMSTWKPRLFILRGRRLSYYYTEDDTEEKGLIDISFHRVLPAHNEMLTGLHAAVTGAGGATNPTTPKDGGQLTAAQEDLQLHPAQFGDDEGIFIFKLVPPKAGLSKAVNFTKPTVHYFAVNSRQEGRLWMAALMKATIDRNDQDGVTTTYNQKTISLARARERRERPPALKEDDLVDSHVDDETSPTSTGLGITAEPPAVDPPTLAGAEQNEKLSDLHDLTASIASIGDPHPVAIEKIG
nr:protein boi2 [Quercus suber]